MQLSTTALDNSFVIPLYVASASALFLIFRIVFASYPVRSLEKYFVRILCHSKEQGLPEAGLEGNESSVPARSLITDLGGPVIYGFKMARFLGCIALLGLATVTLILQGDDRGPLPFQDLDCSQLAVCATAVSEQISPDLFTSASDRYTPLCLGLSVTTRLKYSRIAASHLVIVLLVLFSAYAYRDLYPLLTFTQEPEDLREGRLLWIKVSILTIISIVLPLLCPTQYIPADPAVCFPRS